MFNITILVIHGQTFAFEGIQPMLRENIHAQDHHENIVDFDAEDTEIFKRMASYYRQNLDPYGRLLPG